MVDKNISRHRSGMMSMKPHIEEWQRGPLGSSLGILPNPNGYRRQVFVVRDMLTGRTIQTLAFEEVGFIPLVVRRSGKVTYT